MIVVVTCNSMLHVSLYLAWEVDELTAIVQMHWFGLTITPLTNTVQSTASVCHGHMLANKCRSNRSNSIDYFLPLCLNSQLYYLVLTN